MASTKDFLDWQPSLTAVMALYHAHSPPYSSPDSDTCDCTPHHAAPSVPPLALYPPVPFLLSWHRPPTKCHSLPICEISSSKSTGLGCGGGSKELPKSHKTQNPEKSSFQGPGGPIVLHLCSALPPAPF